MMKFISLCSGIEAASVAFSPLGWQAICFSEIEKFPSEVLAHHYPNVPNMGDMTRYVEWPEEFFADADMIVGGPPCQPFSAAGKRGGLDDDRGNLTLTFTEIINHADRIRRKHNRPPVIVLYENVPGIFSDKTNAFGCLLGALAGEDEALVPSGKKWTNAGAVFGPERAVAWRVLDAQYFGLAQRRKRVFLIASARDGFCPAKVLFEFDGVRRDTPPSREQGQEATGNAGAGFTPSSFGQYREGVGTIRASGGDLGGGSETLVAIAGTQNDYFRDATNNLAPTLRSGSGGGVVNQAVAIQSTVIGRKPENGPQGSGYDDTGVCFTQTAVDRHAVATPTAVRRLTPVECERLQGFPDNWTKIPWRNKPAEECPDGHRYKALGNSWAVPVVQWIGKRIANHLNEKYLTW